MVLQGGLFMLYLVDFYAASYTVLLLATVQIIGFVWIYGTLICKELNTINLKYQVGQLFLLRYDFAKCAFVTLWNIISVYKETSPQKLLLLCKKFFIDEFQLERHEQEWRTRSGGSRHGS